MFGIETQLVIAGLLIVIVLLLAISTFRRPRVQRMEYAVAEDFNAQLDEFVKATTHHVEVGAVLQLTKSITDNPQLSQQLAGYSKQVVEAALVHRANVLGTILAGIDNELQSQYAELATSRYSGTRETAQKRINDLEATRQKVEGNLNTVNLLMQDGLALV